LIVDVPAFMLASKGGVGEVMDSKKDKARDFADRLDEVRSREIRPHPPIGIPILTFHSRNPTPDQIGISQHSGRTYLKDLQRLWDSSGVLPTSFTPIEGLDDIGERPFTSSGFADLYKARRTRDSQW